MAAILHPQPIDTALVEPSRPRFVVLEGGRAGGSVPAPSQRSPLRRYLTVLALALSGVVGLWSMATAPAAHVAAAPSSGVHVVAAGESLWSIAGQLGAEGDRRDVVDRLADVNGGYEVSVHQQLLIPSDLVVSGR